MLFFATKKLSNLENARFEAEVLLAKALQVERSYLRTHLEERVSFFRKRKFFRMVHLRSQYVPVAYICGSKDWCGLRIAVSPAVLIPRDETELLIQKIIDAHPNPKKILDIGTGSGCIALVLAKQYKNAAITAMDVSRAALRIAKKNFKTYGVVIETKYSDLLSAIPVGSFFDIIVANLPYVPLKCPVSKSVQKEPQEALFSGEDGLDLLRRFAGELDVKQIQFDVLWLEFLPQQWKEIQRIFQNWHVESQRDLNGDIYFAKITQK